MPSDKLLGMEQQKSREQQEFKPVPIVAGQTDWIKRETARRLRRQMTPSERRLWQHLRASRLAGLHFRSQQVVEGFIADFYCPAAQIIVEVDGVVHASQTEYDVERSRIFSHCGIAVLRFGNTQVDQDIYSVTAALRTAALPRL